MTNIVDPHSDAVIKHIKNKDSVFRFNTDELLSSFSFDFLADHQIASCYLKNPIESILNTQDITCIYYRRPEKPNTQEQSNIEKLSAEEAWHGFYHVLFDAYKKAWLGHPHRDKYASSRVVQLKTAGKVGWKIPPTIISKDPKNIREFANKYKDLAIKPLGEKGTSIDGQWYPYFTSRISFEQIADKSDSEISATYNYLQAYIPKQNEWRITVIGNDVFPCIIRSQESEDGKTDWRTVDFKSIQHEKATINDKFKQELIEYLRLLHLPFGAFDFILTPNNEFVFLECNPNGQWLWIEELTGMPISRSIANWLENTHHDNPA